MRRWKRAIPLALLLSVVAGSSYALGWSNIFEVKTVAISGSSHEALINEKLRAAGISLHIGQRLARVDVNAVDRVLSSIDWLATRKISRNWLSGKVSIALTEKQAIASFANQIGAIEYFDRGGNIFHSPDSQANSVNLPNVQFIHEDQASREAAAKLISALPSDLLATFQGLQVSAADELIMASSLRHPTLAITWGDANDINEKVTVLRVILARPENLKMAAIDLTVPSNPTAK